MTSIVAQLSLKFREARIIKSNPEWHAAMGDVALILQQRVPDIGKPCFDTTHRGFNTEIDVGQKADWLFLRAR